MLLYGLLALLKNMLLKNSAYHITIWKTDVFVSSTAILAISSWKITGQL